ncbi:hypothetical protein CPC08DRAFT_759537 [Agrocybe pediades]|nr:hypothetical protein CPC08DRAFT_759537 [Agrocybe pediades]
MEGLIDPETFFKSMGLDTAPKHVGKVRRPKFVKFEQGDRGDFLPDCFFEDPRTWDPEPGPLGQVHAWGLYPYHFDDDPVLDEENKKLNWPNFDGVQAAMRKMNYQFKYRGKLPNPETQFMDVLLERKEKQLKNIDLKGLEKRDVLCRISLSGVRDKRGQPRIWRRFRVSAGITLSTFQDKAIAPIMGWVRNFHCYTFTDFRDGALFGPVDMQSVDFVHAAHVGYDYLPDNKYKLAHLFGQEGDQIGYLYDFGDRWMHTIEVLKIFPLEESTGALELIDGKGMCPGENMRGCHQYEEFLKKYDAGSPAEKAKMKREILDSPNYTFFGKAPALFDPDSFNEDEARERLAEALSSSGSVRAGPKKFTMPIMPGALAMVDDMENPLVKKNQTITKQSDGDGLGQWREITSSGRDSRKEAVCAQCGKPAAPDVKLKVCGGCRQVM